VKLTRERQARPSPPPLEANDQMVTVVGTAAWAVALVVLLIVRDSLPAGQRWWIWTCACGLVMGLFALWYVPRLKRARARAAARRAAAAGNEQNEHGEPAGQAQSAPRDNGSKTVSSTDTPGRSTRS
jgi:type VI protein secretion system component VasK